jgi:hypothetical protein
MKETEAKSGRTQEISIELPEDVAQGIYTNLAIIFHSPSEFIFDFVRVLPGTPKAKVQSRLILTPEHAKRFLFALSEHIKSYESQFGEIKVHEMHVPPFQTPPFKA